MRSKEILYRLVANSQLFGKLFVCSCGENEQYRFRITQVPGCTKVSIDAKKNNLFQPVLHIPDFSEIREEEMFQFSTVWEFNDVPLEFVIALQKTGFQLLNKVPTELDFYEQKYITIQY